MAVIVRSEGTREKRKPQPEANEASSKRCHSMLTDALKKDGSGEKGWQIRQPRVDEGAGSVKGDTIMENAPSNIRKKEP